MLTQHVEILTQHVEILSQHVEILTQHVEIISRQFKNNFFFCGTNTLLYYSEHIDKYLQDEIQFGAIYGPFDSKPFPLHVSPFMT